MDVICAPNYEPSKDDILASRVRTTGVIQEEYMIWVSAMCSAIQRAEIRPRRPPPFLPTHRRGANS